MYDAVVTGNAIERSEARLRIQFADPLFHVEPHSFEECRAMHGVLEKIRNPDTGSLDRELTTEEVRWICSERSLCRHDFRYWLTRYAWILGWDGQLKPFIPNIGQGIILDYWAERERKGLSISDLVLKARQIGITTLCQLKVAHEVPFYAHTEALVGSSDPKNSKDMFYKQERCWKHLPWWMLPEITAYNEGSLVKFGKQDSEIRIQWLNQKGDIGRGATLRLVHLSEVAQCENSEEKIDSGLMRAMHVSPRLWRIFESTAEQMNDWWHRTWLSAVSDFPLGRGNFRPTFLPWFVASDLYPTETWLLEHPIPEDWKPANLTMRHAHRAEAYVQRNELLHKHMGAEWKMPRQQMYYWELEREAYKQKNALNVFYRELCSDDLEAFQQKQHGVFDAELISLYREKTREPEGVFGLVAKPDIVPLRLQPDYRDVDADIKPVIIRTRNGQEYLLRPVKYQGTATMDPDKRIFIWELPKDGCDYGIGLDPSFGVGKDRTAIEILRKASITQSARIVCELVSAYMNANDAVPFMHALGTFYTSQQKDGRMLAPKAIIEAQAEGRGAELALRKLGWSRFHSFVDYSRKIIDQAKAPQLGTFTSEQVRAMIFDYLVKALRDGFLEVDSRWFINEMATLGQGDKIHRLQASLGCYDDRLLAGGWAFVSMHILDRSPYVPLFGQSRIEEEAGPRQYDTVESDWQNCDTGPMAPKGLAKYAPHRTGEGWTQ